MLNNSCQIYDTYVDLGAEYLNMLYEICLINLFIFRKGVTMLMPQTQLGYVVTAHMSSRQR